MAQLELLIVAPRSHICWDPAPAACLALLSWNNSSPTPWSLLSPYLRSSSRHQQFFCGTWILDKSDIWEWKSNSQLGSPTDASSTTESFLMYDLQLVHLLVVGSLLLWCFSRSWACPTSSRPQNCFPGSWQKWGACSHYRVTGLLVESKPCSFPGGGFVPFCSRLFPAFLASVLDGVCFPLKFWFGNVYR